MRVNTATKCYKSNRFLEKRSREKLVEVPFKHITFALDPRKIKGDWPENVYIFSVIILEICNNN